MNKKYIKPIVATILVACLLVTVIIFINKIKIMGADITSLEDQLKIKDGDIETLGATITSLEGQLDTKDIEIEALENAAAKGTTTQSPTTSQNNKSNQTNTQTEVTKEVSNNERLVNFFTAKGITIPLNSSEWNFATTSNAQSYGGPSDWGDNPVIFVWKVGVKDGITVEEGIKYMYCPALEKGAKIISENNTFKVEQIY